MAGFKVSALCAASMEELPALKREEGPGEAEEELSEAKEEPDTSGLEAEERPRGQRILCRLCRSPLGVIREQAAGRAWGIGPFVDQALKHAQQQHFTATYGCVVEGCGRSLTLLHDLVTHSLIDHHPQDTYEAMMREACKVYQTLIMTTARCIGDSLTEHIRAVFLRPEVECVECGPTGQSVKTNNWGAGNHVRTHHMTRDELAFRCPAEGCRFVSKFESGALSHCQIRHPLLRHLPRAPGLLRPTLVALARRLTFVRPAPPDPHTEGLFVQCMLCKRWMADTKDGVKKHFVCSKGKELMVGRLSGFSAEARKALTRQACFGFRRLGFHLGWRLRTDHPDLVEETEPPVLRFESLVQPWLLNALVGHRERLAAKYPPHAKLLINVWTPSKPFGRMRCGVCRGWTKVHRPEEAKTAEDLQRSTLQDVFLHLRQVHGGEESAETRGLLVRCFGTSLLRAVPLNDALAFYEGSGERLKALEEAGEGEASGPGGAELSELPDHTPPPVSRSRSLTSRRKWTCLLCGKVVLKNNLTQHTAIHHLDEPMLKCKFCPYAEKYAGLNVRKHMRSTHPAEDAEDFVDQRKARHDELQTLRRLAFFAHSET